MYGKTGNGQSEEQEKTPGHASDQTALEGSSEGANGKGTCQEQEGNQGELEGQGSEAVGGSEHAEHDDQADQDTPDELTLVRAQLVAQEALAKEKDDLLLRERAELENFKRRMQREKTSLCVLRVSRCSVIFCPLSTIWSGRSRTPRGAKAVRPWLRGWN